MRVIKSEPVRVPQPRPGVALSDISTDASDELAGHNQRGHVDLELGDVESVGSLDDSAHDVVPPMQASVGRSSVHGGSSRSLKHAEDAGRPRSSRGKTASSASLARSLRQGRDFGSNRSLHSDRSSRSRRDRHGDMSRSRRYDRDMKEDRARAAEAVH